MKYSSMGNLRDKEGKLASRKQLANGESFHVVVFFLIL